MEDNLKKCADQLAQNVASVTSGSINEATLRHELEKLLEACCNYLDIPWTPFRLEVTLRTKNRKAIRFADVIHGAVIIEYEAPASFKGKEGSKLKHAQNQADEYALLIQKEEGRALDEYILVAWDGSHIAFGKYVSGVPVWQRLTPFNNAEAKRLIAHLRNDGMPIVHPLLLSSLIGPESNTGKDLIKLFFSAIRSSCDEQEKKTNKTKLLYKEWRRLFSQVTGAQSDKLKDFFKQQEIAHGKSYENHVPEYLFALNTYIALVAKIVSALSLPNAAQDISDANVQINTRMEALESGTLFLDAGIADMFIGDFFSWYLDHESWPYYSPHINSLVNLLKTVSFDVTRKSPDTTRDLFKGIYQAFVPAAIRHTFGEYYTPDWLAEHVLDQISWPEDSDLLDPTCGTGTFLLEGLRRRLKCNNNHKSLTAKELLKDIYGIDLNPIAVLTARASIVVFLAPYLDPVSPIKIPVFLADSINPASAMGDFYEHKLQTELGVLSFKIPTKLIQHPDFYQLFARIRDLVNEDYDGNKLEKVLKKEFPSLQLNNSENEALISSLETLVKMHQKGWDGIWCQILAERFSAATIPRVNHIAGNPPWVKWSNLPPEYAEFLKPRCLELGIFSTDRWVGGIESDISTIVTYQVVDKWLAKNGKIAFLITGTVFANESSQGFRRFNCPQKGIEIGVEKVEDYKNIKPFDGVSNHPTLLIASKGKTTTYPLPYVLWKYSKSRGPKVKQFSSATEFRNNTMRLSTLAAPVPGTDAGPWLKGSRKEHSFWKYLFGGNHRHYQARKGVTADRNGIFFLEILQGLPGEKIEVRNDPRAGRISKIPQITARIEAEHVFPLLRGRGLKAFSAAPDSKYHIVVPQRGMNGDPNLPETTPATHKFLQLFKSILQERSSYRRYQKNQPYWSLWSTGDYTFSKYKVLWKEMSGKNFAAAYIGDYSNAILGNKLVIPDHKLYFVPVDTEDEAAYLTGFLNAPIVVAGVVSYASVLLSLGKSVIEYLYIPQFNPKDATHMRLSILAKKLNNTGIDVSESDNNELNAIVTKIVT